MDIYEYFETLDDKDLAYADDYTFYQATGFELDDFREAGGCFVCGAGGETFSNNLSLESLNGVLKRD
ncbi:hypothetical protein vBCjeMWX1_0173 [Campylobacter phage vB_CjeM_WX1]|nr:hypothetical protein vBCjeMWX1_0173 [Campylobacter phage vB_CjeM_WX1]